MKARAPIPPQVPQPAPRRIFRNADGGGMEANENVLMPEVDFKLTLPHGYQTSVTEDGSKALMDLLVELCSRHHLNPALHTLELLSPEGHPLGFKPNSLLGSLNVASVLIKEKVLEEKVVRRPAPKVPEKTVRLMVNYHGSQKAVVRVNPLVPLQALTPVICDKCEFDPAHVLLLRDGISRRELPLDKSLTELGIKELYVHDQTLVLLHKMASAPVLNYSDSIRSSTTSLGKAEKKGLLGIFQFSRRKSKTGDTSVDMDDCDDKVIQNTDTQPNRVSRVSSVEDRPITMAQSQSVTNMSRMADIKKRRAPARPEAPTPIMGHAGFEGYQMGLGSESQQRKRKAPAPPPTPASITPGSDDIYATITPAALRTKVAESAPVSSTTVIVHTIKPVPLKNVAQPVIPTASSPTPSSSTTDSLATHDSSSEISHSLEDSDADLDQAGSYYSTLTSSTASGSVRMQPAKKSSSSRMEESEMSSSMAAKSNQEGASASSSSLETESAINLKLDEVESNRHSAMGTTDQAVPPKPRRSPALEPAQVAPSTPPPLSPPTELTENLSPDNPMEEEEAAPQSWLHSMGRSAASGQRAETETPEEETVSLGSSSGGSSLPDQGYAASEGMAEGEDSGLVSSPSDTQPTSPDGGLSLGGSSRGGGGERLLGPARDNSSDSDEGCATWGSRHRHTDISRQAKSSKLKDGYDKDPQLTAQLHRTLADFEANIAEHIDIGVKDTPYTMSMNSNDVPVSVVDMDVPVTAIDEVLEEFERDAAKNEAKSLTRSATSSSKGLGFCQQSSTEPQNKNNNACTAAESNKSSSASTKQTSQPKQHRKASESKPVGDKHNEKIIETKIKDSRIANANSVKEDKQRTTSAVKSDVDVQKHSKSTEIKPDPVKSSPESFQEKKPVQPPPIQRSVSTERVEQMHRVFPNNSSSGNAQGKITRNVTSRFGMKTFTVVPPKPSVMHAAAGSSAGTSIAGAIKIDDQGNMVKMGQSKAGGSSESGINSPIPESPLLGKAKAFWSSNERQESPASHSKGQINKAKENTPLSIPDTTWKTSNTEQLQRTKSIPYKPAEKAQPKEMVKEEAKEPVRDIHVAKEVEMERGISVPKNIQQPSNKHALPAPLLPDTRRDLCFLKPSRRTSSHYVASAINKYTPKTSAKPNSIPIIPESSVSVKAQADGFQRFGRSIQVNPHQSSQSSLSENKENDSASKPNPSGPMRSMSFPEYVSGSQRDFEEVRPDRGGFGSCVGSTRGSSNTLERETAKNQHITSSGPTQINVTTNNDRDTMKRIQPRSPNFAESNPPHSSAKPATASTTSIPSSTGDMTKAPPHPTPDARPQPSVTVSGSVDTSQPVTLFGPVKKFRPVTSKSLERETSLHGSLMEAIQTEGGRDRLKKLSNPASSSTKKGSYVEEENERSALLAAIRAKSHSGRLRKTKSEAADELDNVRKLVSEEERRAAPHSSPSSPFLTPSSPPVFSLTPPPPAPMFAPPPPPPVLPQGRLSAVAHPSGNTPMNPAVTREAMLEAIRSGSAVERLKKVAVPTKTIQVNGRLGTIQATSAALPQQ
ncbi:protein cordon-bleu isoform X2 [Platichthys flesus]|nr:protein cordon-bleu isoform X2 [Platichthys flesus]XP_062254479.1 protein cordon-bleu isoform X2 [Platichthys flesus]